MCSKMSTSVSGTKKELIYRRSEYLALRNEEDGFYLCQVLQHVYASTIQFKIQWLSERPQQADTYKLDYIDQSQPDCIITHVKLNKLTKNVYRLPENQKKKIQKHLNEALNPDEEEDEEEESEQEEIEEVEESGEEKEEEESSREDDEDSEDEPPAKRRRGSPPSKSTVKPRARAGVAVKAKPKKAVKKKVVATKSKLKKSPSKKAEPKKSKKKADKPEKPKKRKLTPEEKANPNLLLVPNTKVKVWNKDPLIHSNEKVPFVSNTAHAKLAFRAVALNDMKLLQSLIDNTKNVSKLDIPHSVSVYKDAITYAVLKENHKAIQLLIKEVYNRDSKKKPRCDPPRCLIDTIQTGRYNRASLGIRAVRKISMSRGCKEGNNALIKDSHHSGVSLGYTSYIDTALSNSSVSMKTLDVTLRAFGYRESAFVGSHIGNAIRHGRRKVAATLIEESEKRGDPTFNKLAKEVLQYDTEELTKTSLREASVKKKAWDNENMTPIHCAAINPNTKYLIALFNVLPEYGITDQKNRRPIHYAAACEKTGPLEFLLNKGVDPDEADAQGFTPLMNACTTGRVHNVELLLNHAKEKRGKSESKDSEEEDDEEEEEEEGGNMEQMLMDKYGVGGINRPNQRPNPKHSLCPIHLAIEADQKEVVACLIKHGVDVHKQLSAGKNKKTPLMVAASVGNMDIVKMLIKEKARVEQKDKLSKTALIHAVMNGHAHIASYLLSLGADPNQADSSGNTSCHYAAAYGWYFCLKVLVDAGADATKSNDWKVSPLGIAFMKGHLGLVDFLLQLPGIDINFKDDQGMTLVALACSSALTTGLNEEVTYLVDRKNADSTIKDVNGNTPLHHLASNDINVQGSQWQPQLRKDAIAQSLKIAAILLRSGCNPSDQNNEGFTPVMAAISQGNTDLVKFLMEKGAEFSASTDSEGKNALHLMAERCMDSNLGQLVEILDKSIKKGSKSGPNILHQMAAQYDKQGLTPLLRACDSYSEWSGSKDNRDEEEDEDEDEEEEDDDDDSDASSDGPSRGKKRKGSDPTKNAKKAKVSVDPSWEQGRRFIRNLFDLCNANPALPNREKELDKGETVPEKEKDRYYHSGKAKFTPLFYVLGANSEQAVTNRKEEIENHNPLLSILLKHLRPGDLNVRNLEGDTPLITAIKMSGAKADDAIRKLVKHGADVNMNSTVKNDPHPTPLMKAIMMKKAVNIIKILLAAKADVNARHRQSRGTALHFAVTIQRDKTDVLGTVKVLVESGSTINAVNKKGRTPLHMAVAHNSGTADATSELETYLIEQGANVWQKDRKGRLPLHYVFTGIGIKYYETIKLDPIELCTTLTSYMMTRSIDVPDSRKMTPLHYAARCGAGVCCTHLVQKKCDINAKDTIGNTPLTLAAIHGHETCTIMLIQKNADINVEAVVVPKPVTKKSDDKSENSDEDSGAEDSSAEDEENMRENHVEDDKDEDSEVETETPPSPWSWKPWIKRQPETRRFPVFQVCVKNDWAGVIFLMLDMLNSSFTMNNAVEAALNTERFNLVLTLVRKVKNNKVLQESNPETGRTLFHTLAVKATPASKGETQESLLVRVADSLKQRGVALNSTDSYGCRPIHYAALMHNAALMKFLIENMTSGNILNLTDVARRTPLAAIFWKCGPTTQAMYEPFQEMDDLDLDGKYMYPEVPLSFGSVLKRSKRQSDQETEYLADHPAYRCTPLIRAIQLQDFDVAKLLLQDGADPNASDSRQRSPLVHAIIRNDIHLVKLLLNHNYTPKADADVETFTYDKTDGTTPFRRPLFGGRARKRTMFKPRWNRGGRRAFTLGRQPSTSKTTEDEDDEEEDEEVTKKENTDINLKKFPTYKRVSAVMMNVKDDDGLTLVHHLVIPLKVGTFDNVAILKILHDAGAPIAEKDNTGLTPLDYALNHNAPNLAKALQKLMGIQLAKWAQPTLLSPSAVSDGLNLTTMTSFNNDAEMLSLKLEEDVIEVDEDEDKPEPDEKLDMEENGEVEMDEEQEMYYDVTMSKIDVKGNFGWGLYNFYIMQIVKHKAKDLWILFNRWGRIGDDGQFQRTPYGKKEDVVKEFKKIFKSKSGNAWENVKRFEPKPKKYRWIDPEDRKKMKKLKDVEFDRRSDVTSKLPDHLQKLMKSFTEDSMLQSAYNQCSVDAELMPFGRMRKETILKATAVLNKLGPLVEEKEKIMSKLPIDDLDHYKEIMEQIETLSNEVFHLVPESGYAYTAIQPIESKNAWSEQMERLTNLVQLELAATIMAGATYRRKEVHPMDYVYRSLGTTLKLLEPDDSESQYLLKYIQSGLSDDGIDNRFIEGIYEVHRPGEFQRLNKLHLDNHRLLFHGTGTANLISILNRGLLVAPPGALLSGHLYGKGIYTSDMFCKSANYCNNYGGKSSDNYVLICEVALGDMLTIDSVDDEDPMKNRDSVYVPGEQGPHSTYRVTLRDGAILPLGNKVTRKSPEGHWWMPDYSEYVVFKSDQVRLRYLVHFKI